MPECPKCGGGAFLSEEELVKILENTEPMKVILKATYQCRACSERFIRLVHDLLDARKKPEEIPAQPDQVTQTETNSETEPAESLKFF